MYYEEAEKRECNECGVSMDKEEMFKTEDEWLCEKCYKETESYLYERADYYANMQADSAYKER